MVALGLERPRFALEYKQSQLFEVYCHKRWHSANKNINLSLEEQPMFVYQSTGKDNSSKARQRLSQTNAPN